MDRPLFLCLPNWRQAGGIPFRADSAPSFCPECLWSTFRAGFGAFSCPEGGWYPVLSRKRCLFLPGMPSGHLPRRIWGIFLPGRRVVSHSEQEKMPFSAPNASGAPSAPDLGHFPARKAVGIPFCAGKDAFFCSKCLWGTFRAGFGAFSCPVGVWYPVPRRKMQL